MRSFAVWYERSKNEEANISQDECADLHINYWSSLPYNGCGENCFFDFGIKVNDISSISKINIYCPYELDKKDIIDLGGKISNDTLINAIFNENYPIKIGVPKHCLVYADELKNFIIYALDENSEIGITTLKRTKNKSDDPNKKEPAKGTIISLLVEDLVKNASPEMQTEKSYYFRIRILASKEKLGLITREVKNVNPFRDAIETTELMDFRINDIRSCCDVVKDKFLINHKFKFNTIHFLVMRDVNHKVVAEGLQYTCRLLEQDIWNQYLDNLQDNILAYHFKKKSEQGKNVNDLIVLIKFTYKKITITTIFWYIISAITIGLWINILYEELRNIGILLPITIISSFVCLWKTIKLWKN